MLKINSYLTFNGNAEEAFNFYRAIFGGEFTELQRFKDNPENSNFSEEEKNKIMHISLPIGNTILMGADNVMQNKGQSFLQGNNFSLSIAPSSEAEAKRLFDGLANGGKITMPLNKTFWNAYFGMLVDPFGIQWLVNYEYPKNA